MESKQQLLEQWDFELQEEKRQHRESRLFLARKMSELEGRELRAAKDEERRLSAFSGSPSPSIERTPPSSRARTPTPKLTEELAHTATQTWAAEDNTAAANPSKRTHTCKRMCRFGLTSCLVVKICVLLAFIIVPELPSETVENMAVWLPVPLVTFASFGNSTSVKSSDSVAGESCCEALQEARVELAKLQEPAPVKEVLPADEQSTGPTSGSGLLPATVDGLPSPSLWFWHLLSLLGVGRD